MKRISRRPALFVARLATARMKKWRSPKLKYSEGEKLKYSKQILQELWPFLTQFNAEQDREREMEGKIQGLPISEIKVPKAMCDKSERCFCNNCKTSIFDFHRSCPKCGYDLCLICCHELRDGSLQGTEEVVGENSTVPRVRSILHLWKANQNGSIPCPPKEMDGCGRGVLELRSVLSDTWVSDLTAKAEELYRRNNLYAKLEGFDGQGWCTCSRSVGQIHMEGENIRKAASRPNSDDNSLYSPTAKEIQPEDFEHFHRHWCKGEPVIVSKVLDTTLGLSWEPMVMWRSFRQLKSSDRKARLHVTAINCFNWSEVDCNVHKFIDGYSDGGVVDKNGWPQLLRLKDWPPSSTFEEELPRHNAEFMSCLPFKEYTHPHDGYLNLACKLPRIV